MFTSNHVKIYLKNCVASHIVISFAPEFKIFFIILGGKDCISTEERAFGCCSLLLGNEEEKCALGIVQVRKQLILK